MGNSASVPEKVFSAVQRNDICGFQTLVADLNAAGAHNPAARAAILDYKDKKTGRTPVQVAAGKNHYQILQQLIQLGADIHVMRPSGGALHDAAAKRHEAAVELLLASGASPFAANIAGRTALDEAVLSGHTGVVRAIEKYAEFSGFVAFKTQSIGGLSSKYKARWAVLMPYMPYRGLSAGGAVNLDADNTNTAAARKPPRRMLWLYKDKSHVSPRCRLWVDGAAIMTHGPAGTEGTLRLHTSHGEPGGDLSTKFAAGAYTIFLRPADLTPRAAAVYQRLVSLLNATNPIAAVASPPQPPQAAPPPPSPAPAPPMPYPTPPPGTVVPPPYYPPVPPVAAYGASASPYILIPPPPSTPPGVPVPLPAMMPPEAAAGAYSGGGPTLVYPGAAGPCPMASPLSLHQQAQMQERLRQASAPPGVVAAGAAVMPPPAGQRLASEPALGYQADAMAAAVAAAGAGGLAQLQLQPEAPGGGGGGGDRFIEHMAALPGESDEAFASRLASAISITSGHSQQALYAHQQAHHQQQQPQWQPDPGAEPLATPGRFPNGPTQQPDYYAATAAAAAAAAAPAASHPGAPSSSSGLVNGNQLEWGGQPPLPPQPAASQQRQMESAPVASASQLLPTMTPTATPGRPQVAAAAAPNPPGPLDDLDLDAVNAAIAAEAAAAAAAGQTGTSSAAPAAPPRPPAASTCAAAALNEEPSAPPAPPAPAPDSEAEQCIICLSAPKEVGFLHGDSVHRCVCRDCSARIAVGSPCPLCRQPVERRLGVF